MSPASKAWRAEHDRYWEIQREVINAGGPLCGGELLPWVPYVPPKGTPSSVAGATTLAPPPPCVVKGAPVNMPTTSTPRASCVPVMPTIEEAEDDTTLESLTSTFSDDTMWSQDSARSSVADTTPALKATSAASYGCVPSIVIKTCPDARHHSLGIELDLFEIYEYGVDYLQVPVPGEEPPQSRPRLGSVNRSNYGGRFKLAAPPKRAPSRRCKENAPPGWL